MAGQNVLETRKTVQSRVQRLVKDFNFSLSQPGERKDTLSDTKAINPETGYWEDPGEGNKPMRWFIHLDLRKTPPEPHLPPFSSARKPFYANLSLGNSAAVLTRLIPVLKLEEDTFRFQENWEILFLLAFNPPLKAPPGTPGASGKTVDDYDPEAGTITYMGEKRDYVAAGLVTLQDADDTFEENLNGQTFSTSYGEVVKQISQFLHVEPAVEPEE